MPVQIPFPVIIAREGKWFVAACPILDIATQEKSENEVRENISDLIIQYMKDPDTPKPDLDQLQSLSLTNVSVSLPEGVLHDSLLISNNNTRNKNSDRLNRKMIIDVKSIREQLGVQHHGWIRSQC